MYTNVHTCMCGIIIYRVWYIISEKAGSSNESVNISGSNESTPVMNATDASPQNTKGIFIVHRYHYLFLSCLTLYNVIGSVVTVVVVVLVVVLFAIVLVVILVHVLVKRIWTKPCSCTRCTCA